MQLSTAQLQTIGADIAATSAVTGAPGSIYGNTAVNAVPNNSDGNAAIAYFYNQPASPDYWAWRSFVPDQEIYEATVDGTSWSWSTFIARSQAERDAWRQMVNMAGGINPSLLNVRNGIADIFSGAGGAAQRTYLLNVSRRLASRVEKVLATGVGTTANPSVLGAEGPISGDEIQAARTS